MAKTELKEIEINKIKPNPLQPREYFDREKLKELAESIKSRGLINPIQIKKKGGIFEIVSGERRWKASQIAKLKKIPAIIKEYKSKEDMAIESLIENVHREDLAPLERAKFLRRIKEIGNLTNVQLAKKVGLSQGRVDDFLSILKLEEDLKKVRLRDYELKDTTALREVSALKDKEDKMKVLKKLKEGKPIREIVRAIKKAPKEIKESLFSEEISVGQAESLSKIHSPKAREQALKQVKQHRHIADITPKLMERAKPELTDAVKKQFDTTQRRIFTYLNDAKVSLSKVNNNLKQANIMLSQLMSKSFEYGLDKRTLVTTIQQMKSISDRLNEFEIENDRFDELKDTFLERVEDRLEELK